MSKRLQNACAPSALTVTNNSKRYAIYSVSA